MNEEQRPLDRSPYYVNYFEFLDRVLGRPQLAGIGISGCIGAGLLINSGSLISTIGSLGAAVSYAVSGLIIACVFHTITEMVACRPLTGALINLPHTFVEPACGFTVAALYVLGELCVIANLTALSAEQTALLKEDQKPHTVGAEAGINIAFVALTTFSHCLGVKFYGQLERAIMWFKLSLLIFVCILMVVLNFSGGHPAELTYYSNYTTHGFVPGWKPTGFTSTTVPELSLHAPSLDGFGLSGAGGRAFAFLTSVTIAMFSCFGADLVAMSAGEAKSPWKDIPATMSFVYLIPLTLYPFVMLAGGSNVNYADPNLPKMWKTGDGLMRSPFVIAAQNSSLHGLPRALNAFFIISAYTSANTFLYAASRNVFMFSQQYLPSRVAKIFGRTNNGHTPIAAILLCSLISLFSLVGLIDRRRSQPRAVLSQIYTGTSACINICQCITFLRFKAGLDRLERKRVFGRNDPLYINHLFKSRWQPLLAYVGITGCTFVVVWSGVPAIVLLVARQRLESSEGLKSSLNLALDVMGAYLGPILFGTLYLCYKLIFPGSTLVDVRDFTIADYVLEDLSTIELECVISVSSMNSRPIRSYELASRDEHGVQPTRLQHEAMRNRSIGSSARLAVEIEEENEAEAARIEEIERLTQILRRRPKRFDNGILREFWSFVVVGNGK